MKINCVVIGGGLSGLAAAIRLSRFVPEVVLLEQHTRPGGLNSYYYRNKQLLETGLHAITNYAEPGDKKAPLNRLLRQLKFPRRDLSICQQKISEVHFPEGNSLLFSNDFKLLESEIADKFPHCIDGFTQLLSFLDGFDPFIPSPYRSARSILGRFLTDALLVDMLLCPLMYYGSSVEDDMDLSQFAIMFQAIFKEGMFRPESTIKDFLETFLTHFTELGGTLRLGAKVTRLLKSTDGNRIDTIELASGEIIEANYIVSTIGYEETLQLTQTQCTPESGGRLGFIESIFQINTSEKHLLPDDRTVIFYSGNRQFSYRDPDRLADFGSGVICLPFNFHGLNPGRFIEIRTTHLASYGHWKKLKGDNSQYLKAKEQVRQESFETLEKILGKVQANIVYRDTFTPVTIERYTSKKEGAIYGSPSKIKNGVIGFDNLFLAGTDQGFLGIVGAMLSGVSIVNQHILPRI